MGITLKTKKTLWAKSGNRCAICEKVLIEDTSPTGVNLNIGEECHIISSKTNGPRHIPNYSKDYDGYENLLLLCRNHHKAIDEDVLAYPKKKLIQIKKTHEFFIKDSISKAISPKKSPIVAIPKISNGKEIIDIIKSADCNILEHSELETEEEVEIISNLLSLLPDYIDLFGMDVILKIDEIKMGLKFNSYVKAIEDAGFVIFGGNIPLTKTDKNKFKLNRFNLVLIFIQRKTPKFEGKSSVLFNLDKIEF